MNLDCISLSGMSILWGNRNIRDIAKTATFEKNYVLVYPNESNWWHKYVTTQTMTETKKNIWRLYCNYDCSPLHSLPGFHNLQTCLKKLKTLMHSAKNLQNEAKLHFSSSQIFAGSEGVWKDWSCIIWNFIYDFSVLIFGKLLNEGNNEVTLLAKSRLPGISIKSHTHTHTRIYI